jgi:thiosulfate/3-mercaptopyruvate sulfurtransferase
MQHARHGLLLDARADERFRGEVEPLDKVAGHIPGAINMPYEDNLDFSGDFMSDEALREHYLAVIGNTAPADIVHMCGSGVTACHNILAMEHAGLPGAKLYAGSWSEWITDPNRPVATGEQAGLTES